MNSKQKMGSFWGVALAVPILALGGSLHAEPVAMDQLQGLGGGGQILQEIQEGLPGAAVPEKPDWVSSEDGFVYVECWGKFGARLYKGFLKVKKGDAAVYRDRDLVAGVPVKFSPLWGKKVKNSACRDFFWEAVPKKDSWKKTFRDWNAIEVYPYGPTRVLSCESKRKPLRWTANRTLVMRKFGFDLVWDDPQQLLEPPSKTGLKHLGKNTVSNDSCLVDQLDYEGP